MESDVVTDLGLQVGHPTVHELDMLDLAYEPVSATRAETVHRKHRADPFVSILPLS